jgi:hypothetical protein
MTRGRKISPGPRFAIVAGCLIGASLLACLAVGLAPKDENMVAAIISPGGGFADATRLAEAADAQIVRQGAFPWVWVFASDRPNLPERLYAQGAWLVLDPLFGGCGDSKLPSHRPPQKS